MGRLPVRREEVLEASGTSEVARAARRLNGHGFARLGRIWPDWDQAKRESSKVVAAVCGGDPVGHGLPALVPVGEFIVPPGDASERDYQALHIDFGLPVASRTAVDIARFTVLYVDASQPGSHAVTRIARLERLFGQRAWPVRSVIAERLRKSAGPSTPVVGILGRLVEAIDHRASLPSTSTPGFLCGMEFSSQREENLFFRSHGMSLQSVEDHVVLQPGEAVVIDNLRTAHGRLGRRNAHELRQLCLGYRSLGEYRQADLLDRVLVAFSAV